MVSLFLSLKYVSLKYVTVLYSLVHLRKHCLASLRHIQIASITTLALWGRYWVKHRWLEHSAAIPRQIWYPRWLFRDWTLGSSAGSIETVFTAGARQCKIWSHYPEQPQFKTYELFISGIFLLLFSDHSWPWKTETTESKHMDKGRLLYSYVFDYLFPSKVTFWGTGG